MQPLALLLAYLVLVFLGGALVAPWLYFLVQQIAEHFPALQKLANNPFHRFVNRSLMVLAVLGLWPLVRWMGIGSWAEAGFKRTGNAGRQAGKGFATGFASLAVVGALLLLAGARSFNLDHSPAQLARHLLNATTAAVAVAILEELLFRGVLFGGLRKAHSWKVALVASSVVYAWVHFMSKPPPPEEINWATGLVVLGQMMRGLADWQVFMPAFLNLTVAGMILALAYRVTGALYFSIGLHAGWIFWLKTFAFLTKPGSEGAAWLGSGKLIDGWAAFGVLALLLAAASRQADNVSSKETHATVH